MLKLRLVAAGKTRIVNVEQFEILLICPYCWKEFPTINPDQIYCKPSHGVMCRQIRAFDRSVPMSISTIGWRLRPPVAVAQ